MIRLQTTDGELKKYSTVEAVYMGEAYNPQPSKWITNCGREWENEPKHYEECDHLECAIYLAEKSTTYSLVVLTVIIGIASVIILSTKMYTTTLIIIIFLSIILASMITRHGPWKKLNELTEFRDNGTINGIKAWQISEEPQSQ
jgi:hypothetical protein